MITQHHKYRRVHFTRHSGMEFSENILSSVDRNRLVAQGLVPVAQKGLDYMASIYG